jgi:single-strand DNA-binding protein
MKNSKNKVEISGYLGTDAEVKNLQSGKTLVSIRLGSVSMYKNKAGEWVTNTIWHHVVMWNALSDALQGKLKKGANIEVSGRLNSRIYTAPDGQKRYMTQIVASDIALAAR